MPGLLTTAEAADYLRLSERKLYDLVLTGAVPCTKITGRWLFPKAALDRWIADGLPGAAGKPVPPPIVGGSHDPLLEWALRESGSRLASLPEGSEAGLVRLQQGEVAVAAIHLHRIDGDDDRANADALALLPGLHDGVLIAFAQREQGLLTPPGNPRGLSDIVGVAASGARLAQRPDGAGAQLLLLSLLSRHGLTPADVSSIKPVCPTGPDVAQAIRADRADCGIATRAVALAAGLDFIPLAWERYDLAMRQRDYFQPGPFALFRFLRTSAFADRAAELGGYDVSEAGSVRQLN